MVKKFTIPFASQGDANDIPDALQVDGKVSFTQGFSYDYERPYDDPQAKDIAREDMNGIFKAITSAVGELQTLGASEWSNAISYPKGAIVYHEKDLYISQVDDNQNKPPQSWVSITSIANDSLKKAANLSDLTNKTTARNNLGLGSSATLNKTDVLGTSTNLVATQKLVNDTKINLDNSVRAVDVKADNAHNIISTLEMNVYSKEATYTKGEVDSLINENKSVGIDQRWSVTKKVPNVEYINSSTRPIQLSVSFNYTHNSSHGYGLIIDGISFAGGISGLNPIIPPGSKWKFFHSGTTTDIEIWELGI